MVGVGLADDISGETVSVESGAIPVVIVVCDVLVFVTARVVDSGTSTSFVVEAVGIVV